MSYVWLTMQFVFRIASEDTSVRVRRSLLAAGGINQTSITLEFGSPPAPNITTPESPTVSEEIAMAREINDSVDLEVRHSYPYVGECRGEGEECKHARPTVLASFLSLPISSTLQHIFIVTAVMLKHGKAWAMLRCKCNLPNLEKNLIGKKKVYSQI